MLLALIPKVFYSDVTVGLDLFTDGVGMEVLHRDDEHVVLARDKAKLSLVEDREFAVKDRPELAIETDDIEAVFAEVMERRPDMLHPNLDHVTSRAWGAREFALLDSTGVCVVLRDWTSSL